MRNNMEEIFYVKKHGRYKPVRYYDSNIMNGFPIGTSIVMTDGTFGCRRYQIDPAFAPMIAAGIYAEDKISRSIQEGSKAELRTKAVTQEEKNAWDNLSNVMGSAVFLVQYPACQDAARAGIKAMQDEANKMLTHPAVRNAYDQFLLIWKLTKEHENE